MLGAVGSHVTPQYRQLSCASIPSIQTALLDTYTPPSKHRFPAFPLNTPNTGYAVMGETCFGTPQGAVLRGWLLSTGVAGCFSRIGGWIERVARFATAIRTAGSIPLILEVCTPDGDTVRGREGHPLCVRTRTQEDGSICFDLTTLGLEEGRYVVHLKTPQRPRWWGGFWGHSREHTPPVLTTALWPVTIVSNTRAKSITVMDLDETLFQNPTATCGDLMRSLLRASEDTTYIPGVYEFIQQQQKHSVLMAVSASPETLRYDIEKSTLQHGLVFEAGIVLKNFPLHMPHLREQISYKIENIAKRLAYAPQHSTLTLVGDNTESDPVVYDALYRFLRRDWGVKEMVDLLQKEHCPQERLQRILRCLERMRDQGIGVERIVIRCVPEKGLPKILNPVMSLMS